MLRHENEMRDFRNDRTQMNRTKGIFLAQFAKTGEWNRVERDSLLKKAQRGAPADASKLETGLPSDFTGEPVWA
jgi:hypothetical protein